MDSLARLWEDNWQLARRSWAGQVFPTAPPERGRWYSELIRETFTPALAAAYMRFIRDLDIAVMLRELAMPVLVIARERDRLVPAGASRSVASALSNATFTLAAGDEGYPPFGDRSYLDTIGRFLNAGVTPEPAARDTEGTAVILFADIVDSTALTERMGDAAFRERARALDEALRAVITAAGGTAIDGKLLGDGVLATFPAASQAIDAAFKCNAAAEATDEGRAEALRLRLHIGIHAGDVIREENNVYGGAVNIAARISGLSAPGEVLVSDIVRGLARTSAGVIFEDRGEHALKGVADPQRVFAVRTAEAG
jgi:class 3 adenylate cyclase